ncbi:hypothetical protein KR054_012439, partial [Drosophila jambulina]
IAFARGPYTSDSILREFRATDDKRLSADELVEILTTISKKRPNCDEVAAEVKQVLRSKDPMYALLVFVKRYSEDGLSPRSSLKNSEMTSITSPLQSKYSMAASSASRASLAEVSHESLSLPTSTPVINRNSGGNAAAELLFPRPMPAGRSQGNNEEDRERADLSLIKERLLLGASNKSLSTFRPPPTEKPLKNGSQKTIVNPLSTPTPTGISEGSRTHSLWDFYNVDENTAPDPEIGALPIESQQTEMLTQLLYCFTGIRVPFIVPIPPDPSDGLARYKTEFAIHNQVERSLAELVRQTLPLASHFVGIQRMVADMDGQGQVINALNAALSDISHDFYLLLIQAEDELQRNELTMQKLVYYMQPTVWVMEEIWTTLFGLQQGELRGAAVLTHLHGRIKRLEGDREAQAVIIGLMRRAAEPYMRMLQLWIQKGVIVDRQQEFLVEDYEGVHCDQLPEHYSDGYWEKRYTLRRDHIPSFLEKYSDKILRTGKYLNVVRQCGKRVMPTQQMHLEFDPTNEQYVSVINEAYYFAARMLLDVLLTENDLMGHLQSVKRYLLLNQGDFTMQFMDACEDELSKNVDLVLPMTLENLLGLTLRISSARDDPYKDHLHCELLPYDLVTQMSKIMDKKEEYWQMQDRLDLSGLECFAFSYEVKWPVSLVLNHLAIAQYQMLFRQLFYCKHVERQLCKIWKENSIAKKFSPQAAELYRSAFTLRQRMMNAIQNLEYYMMIEIIEPNWHIFIEKMQAVENVDNVLKLHQDFIDSCLKNCMLSESSHLNRAIFKLCRICLKFCDFIQRSQRFFLDAELKSMVCDSSDDSSDESDPECLYRPQLETSLDPADTFSERVKRFDLEFTGILISFLKKINIMAKENTADRFMNLVHRINFNGFYTDLMEKLCIKDALG